MRKIKVKGYWLPPAVEGSVLDVQKLNASYWSSVQTCCMNALMDAASGVVSEVSSNGEQRGNSFVYDGFDEGLSGDGRG